MRFLGFVFLVGALLASGCANRKAAGVSGQGQSGAPLDQWPVAASGPGAGLIVTPTIAQVGKVIMVNRPGRFVVLNFPPGHRPMVDERLGVYHNGLKTGEVRITAQQDNDNVIADLVTGTAELGDEAREQ